MNSTLERLRDFLACGLKAQRAVDDVQLMQRSRACLSRWASQRARSARARQRVAETRQLIDAIDQWLLKR